MNYTNADSVITSYFNGSRRLNNIFWAFTVSLGGFGFFLTGLASFLNVNLLFFSDSSEISFIPQGIVLLFYGTVGSILGIFLTLTVWWNVGSGYNEYMYGKSCRTRIFLCGWNHLRHYQGMPVHQQDRHE